MAQELGESLRGTLREKPKELDVHVRTSPRLLPKLFAGKCEVKAEEAEGGELVGSLGGSQPSDFLGLLIFGWCSGGGSEFTPRKVKKTFSHPVP